jgi:hypothetical protein
MGAAAACLISPVGMPIAITIKDPTIFPILPPTSNFQLLQTESTEPLSFAVDDYKTRNTTMRPRLSHDLFQDQ